MTQRQVQNHFELLNLPVQFAIDLSMLDTNYRKLQSEVHPDRFAAAPIAERLQSMQLATQANEAYRSLKNATARARYLLEINGIDTAEESNTAMPPDFLVLQMEWREAIEDARASNDVAALQGLKKDLQQEAGAMHAQLQICLDQEHSYAQAAGIVRKLSFLDRLREDIDLSIFKLQE
jgi:molecular chaperone HscB